MKITRFPRFFLGLAVGVLFSVTAAYAINVDNTPESGYLLCVNSKTKAVTYPGVLKCPSGSKALEMGAQGAEGPEGPDGSTGATGPAGPSADSSILFTFPFPSRDIVGTKATTAKDLKKVVLATLSSDSLKGGTNYEVTAHISGNWASQSALNDYIQCYFQLKADFPDGNALYGSVNDSYSKWTSLSLTAFAVTTDRDLTKDDLYLVCATNGVVQNVSGYIHAHSIQRYIATQLKTNPS